MNDSMSFNYGDLVWAKMKGYCAWPGRIVEPTDELQKVRKTEKSFCVYFFGSNNYAWIDDKNVHPYLDYKQQMVKLGKPKASFDKAVEEIENYMSNPETSHVTITPARKKSIAKVRPSDIAPEVKDEDENHVNESVVAAAEDEEIKLEIETETPKKPSKAQPNKRSTQKKTPKAPVAKKKKAPSEDPEEEDEEEVIPAKRQRQNNSSPAVRNSTTNVSNNNNNNSIELSQSQDSFSSSLKKEFSSPVVPRPSHAARAIIERSIDVFSKPEENDLDVATISETLKSKNITASSSKFGFIGLGIMGSGIVKNLLNSGHDVCVYNRTKDKTVKFEEAGAKVMLTPSDVIEYADITFSCVSDPKALKETIFGRFGVSTLPSEIARGKGFVEMTTIDADTSRDIESALQDIGINYLEAQIHGTKAQAEEGKLIILAAGDKTLFDSCQTCFEAMGKNSFFVGDTGNATKMNLVIQTITGITIAGLADSIALAERANLSAETFMEILSNTNLRSELIMNKGMAMVDNRFSQVSLPLQHMQKDLRLALNMADNLNQPMPLTAIANEAYKNARRYGLSESDVSAICYRARH